MPEGKISFYGFITRYPHDDPDRKALASGLREISAALKAQPKHRKEKSPRQQDPRKIDSLTDLFATAEQMGRKYDGGFLASLWYEYCYISGRKME